MNFSFCSRGDFLECRRRARPGPGHCVQTRISTFICPSEASAMDARNADQLGSHFPVSPTSYAAVIGYQDTLRWWYGCPYFIPPDGVFGYGYGARLSEVTDGTSNTMFVRRGEPVQERGRSLVQHLIVCSGMVVHPRGFSPTAVETTAPKLNADLQIPDPNPSLDHRLGRQLDLRPGPSAPRPQRAGQFGFRSQHRGGADSPSSATAASVS